MLRTSKKNGTTKRSQHNKIQPLLNIKQQQHKLHRNDHETMTTTQLEHEVGRISLSDDAPAVDLNMFVVENKGLAIQSHPEMGRVMVAVRDFGREEVGSPILIEKPCLVCQQNDEMGFLEQFLEAPVEVQVGILDMFFVPMESRMGPNSHQTSPTSVHVGSLGRLFSNPSSAKYMEDEWYAME